MLGVAIVAGCAHAPPAAPKPTADHHARFASCGQVQMVNTLGRFVAATFPSGTMPAMDQRMAVYRDGQKIGEIKITGPQREFNIVAEILSRRTPVPGRSQSGMIQPPSRTKVFLPMRGKSVRMSHCPRVGPPKRRARAGP